MKYCVMRTAISWKEKNIVRLDDHQIILDSFTQWCKRQNPEISIKNYSDPDNVFLQIVTSLTKGEKIDLFITDYAHAGLNGYEMCKSIRAIERALNRQPMPILLLTLFSSQTQILIDGLKEGVFTRYLSLEAVQEDVMECIQEMLFGMG